MIGFGVSGCPETAARFLGVPIPNHEDYSASGAI